MSRFDGGGMLIVLELRCNDLAGPAEGELAVTHDPISIESLLIR